MKAIELRGSMVSFTLLILCISYIKPMDYRCPELQGVNNNTGLFELYKNGLLGLHNTGELKIWVWRNNRYKTTDFKIVNVWTDWYFSLDLSYFSNYEMDFCT